LAGVTALVEAGSGAPAHAGARPARAAVPAEPVRAATTAETAIFYAEHTFGAHDSISDPGNAVDAEQWGHKAGQAWQLQREATLDQEEAWGRVQVMVGPRGGCGTLAVFNPCGWTRSDLVTVFVPHAMAPAGVDLALDHDGRLMAGQVASTRPEGTYWTFWCAEVPPFGLRSYAMVEGTGDADDADDGSNRNEHDQARPTSRAAGAARRLGDGATTNCLANHRLALQIDPAIAAVSELREVPANRQLVDHTVGLGLGRLLRETIASRRELEHFRCETAERTPVSGGRLVGGGEGALWSWLGCTGTVATPQGDAHLQVEVRLLRSMPRIICRYRLRKPACYAPEAWYVAFPFALEDAEVYYDHPGAFIRPGQDQIPGTASDWHTVQNVVALRQAASQWLWTTPDIPLVQLGGLHLGRFLQQPPVPEAHIYSWVANNYWVTNFRPSWEGELAWRYALEVCDDPSVAAALRTGHAAKQPLLGRVLPSDEGAAEDTIPATAARLTAGMADLPPHVLPLSLRQTDEGIVVHLREVAGEGARIDVGAWLHAGRARVQVLDPLFRAQGRPVAELELPPYSTAFLRLLPE
jgi:hypothetical protein